MIQRKFEASTITDAIKMDADYSKEDPLLYATHFLKSNFANVSLLGPEVRCSTTSGLKLLVSTVYKNHKGFFLLDIIFSQPDLETDKR